jgi:RimJ/RimL family protein N-acetyltransferase
MLDMADRPRGEFRGAQETGGYRWLAWDQEQAVGYIDCGTFDRWTRWEGGPNGRGAVSVILVPSGAIAFVVDPRLRGRGYCTTMIEALTQLPELAHIALFGAGIEPDNVASVGCLVAAGFTPEAAEPDWEGLVYYVWSR